ncbi:hypothetical protein CPB86DRAFT_870688 [Serendipita vermifera]|nr:hypothetical protein CPB86DRAFT_870688 [Serendipita vermifera]
MSTYEFQINVNPEQYQNHSAVADHHARHAMNLSASSSNGTPMLTPESTNTPQPIIIQYDAGHSKQPYGSGDHGEGFTLEFPTFEAFQTWKTAEEENNCVDYFTVDTHHSKAVPPRFKDHVKLACSRHTRAGSKKYEKKFPERQRKVPSKKLEGVGCPSTISYKTYFESTIVRVNYNSQHSHDIGPANLPYTKKGRKHNTRGGKSSNAARKSSAKRGHSEDLYNTEQEVPSSSASDAMQFVQPLSGNPSLPPSPTSMGDPLDLSSADQISYDDITNLDPSAYDHPMERQSVSPTIPQATHQHLQQAQQSNQQLNIDSHDHGRPFNSSQDHNVALARNRNLSTPVQPITQYSHPYHQGLEHQQHSSEQMQRHSQVATHSISHQSHRTDLPPPLPPPTLLSDRRQETQVRWDRLETMFGHVRQHARNADFAEASLAALEMIMLRLYLETPVNAPAVPMHGNQHSSNSQHQQGHLHNHSMI